MGRKFPLPPPPPPCERTGCFFLDGRKPTSSTGVSLNNTVKSKKKNIVPKFSPFPVPPQYWRWAPCCSQSVYFTGLHFVCVYHFLFRVVAGPRSHIHMLIEGHFHSLCSSPSLRRKRRGLPWWFLPPTSLSPPQFNIYLTFLIYKRKTANFSQKSLSEMRKKIKQYWEGAILGTWATRNALFKKIRLTNIKKQFEI